MALAEWMRTSGPRRSLGDLSPAAAASDSVGAVARHVRPSAIVVGRTRGRRRVGPTARHGRGVRALPVRALPHGGRVQRGAAGAAQPAAARAAARPLLGVAAPRAPLRRGGARAQATLRAAGRTRARGALRAAAASASTAPAGSAWLLPATVQASVSAQVLRPAVPRGHCLLAATLTLRGVRGCCSRAPAGLHATSTPTSTAATTMRPAGTSVLRAGSQEATATAWLVSDCYKQTKQYIELMIIPKELIIYNLFSNITLSNIYKFPHKFARVQL